MNNSDIESKANICLNCNNKPCSTKGCPLNNDIPLFISAIKEVNYKKAYDVIRVAKRIIRRAAKEEKKTKIKSVNMKPAGDNWF